MKFALIVFFYAEATLIMNLRIKWKIERHIGIILLFILNKIKYYNEKIQ